MRKFGFRVFFKYLCLATLTSTIFAMDPCIIQTQNYPLERALWNIFGALQYTPAVFSFLIPVIAFFYYHSDKFFCGKISEPIATLSAIAAFITMLGVSYYKTGGWDLVFSTENGQIIKAVILILSYWIFFYYIFLWAGHLFTVLVSAPPFSNDNGRYSRYLYKHTYVTIFCTLLPLYLVLLVFSYPSIPTADSVTQILQSLGDEPLTAHHPVIHTYFMAACIKICIAIFSSANAGLLLISVFQLTFSIIAISYAINTMIHKLQLPKAIIYFTIAYYCFNPMIQRSTFDMTKDILYSAFYLCFLVSLFLHLSRQQSRYDSYILVFSCILFVLFRNEAKFISILFFVLLAIAIKNYRKIALSLLFLTVVVSALMGMVIQPLLNIEPGSRREMLSIPFQQTARYLLEYPDDVTESEIAAIDAVLDYDTIAEAYNPNFSDPVKITFKDSATMSELSAYFKTWAAMFIRHPDSCLQATLNNYYQYYALTGEQFEANFTLNAWLHMDTLSTALSPYGVGFNQTLESIRIEYEFFLYLLFQLPVLSVFLMPAIYTWVLLALTVWSILKKNTLAFAACIFPVITLVLVCFGPCNGSYGRYQYPIIFSLPFIVGMCVYASKNIANPEKART